MYKDGTESEHSMMEWIVEEIEKMRRAAREWEVLTTRKEQETRNKPEKKNETITNSTTVEHKVILFLFYLHITSSFSLYLFILFFLFLLFLFETCLFFIYSPLKPFWYSTGIDLQMPHPHVAVFFTLLTRAPLTSCSFLLYPTSLFSRSLRVRCLPGL